MPPLLEPKTTDAVVIVTAQSIAVNGDEYSKCDDRNSIINKNDLSHKKCIWMLALISISHDFAVVVIKIIIGVWKLLLCHMKILNTSVSKKDHFSTLLQILIQRYLYGTWWMHTYTQKLIQQHPCRKILPIDSSSVVYFLWNCSWLQWNLFSILSQFSFKTDTQILIGPYNEVIHMPA